ncbi:hypothetical protein TWF694_007986 [Orbilia ellipsospora]|uniref:Uncharacterized protein n=1 Tax=Orbilia ellipsospora TaxID=2528407 RepID=A0AAV9XG92_9PEZI
MWFLPCNIFGWGEGFFNFKFQMFGALCGTGGILITGFAVVLRTASYTGAADYPWSDSLLGVNNFLGNDNCFYPSGNAGGGVFDLSGLAWYSVYNKYRIYSYDGMNVGVNITYQSGGDNFMGTCSSPIVIG